jgi:hypothetical protein
MKTVSLVFDVYDHAWVWFIQNLYDYKSKWGAGHQFDRWAKREFRIVEMENDQTNEHNVLITYEDDGKMFLFIMRFS